MGAKGLFITFDGGEGGGKTTQTKLLADWLMQRGHDVVLTREPGGTQGALAIRELLVTGDPDRWKPTTETLLYAAARHETIQRVTLPALAAGKIVISDRYNDSTIAYQGNGRQQDIPTIRTVLEIATQNLKPDLTFIMDLPVAVSLARSQGGQTGEDRFEREEVAFHERMHAGYREMAAAEPDRCLLVDATQPLQVVTATLCRALEDRFGL